MTSGHSRQNLVYTIVSLSGPSSINFDSVWVRGRFISRSQSVFHIESFVRVSHYRSSLNSSVSSCQIVSRFLSPEIHMNLHLGEVRRDNSPASVVDCCVGLCQGFVRVLDMDQILFRNV